MNKRKLEVVKLKQPCTYGAYFKLMGHRNYKNAIFSDADNKWYYSDSNGSLITEINEQLWTVKEFKAKKYINKF